MRRRSGVALVLVLILLMVVTSFVLAYGAFRSGATWDVVADHLTLETLGLAESAADETAIQLGRRGNTNISLVFRGLRRDGFLGPVGPGPWTLGAPARQELLGSALPGFEQLTTAIRGGAEFPRFELAGRDIGFVVQDRFGTPHLLDIRGELLHTATVRGQEAKRTVTRSVARRQGFRLTRLGLPYPFDSLVFFSRNAHTAMDRSRAVFYGEMISGDLENLDRSLGTGLSMGGMNAVRQRLTRLKEVFRAEAHGVFHDDNGTRRTYANCAMYDRPDRPVIENLKEWQLGEKCHRFRPEIQEAQSRLIPALQALQAQDPGQAAQLESALQGYLDMAEKFRELVQPYFAEHLFQGHTKPKYREAFGPAIDNFVRFDEWKARAWYKLQDMSELEQVFPGNRDFGQSIARNGLVHLVPPGGTAQLSTASVWGTPAPAPGRLFLLVDGNAVIRDIDTPPGALLTIVTKGSMKVDGTVGACLVTLDGMELASGSTVKGNVIHLKGPLIVGDQVRLVRNQEIFTGSPGVPPDESLYHLALDPSLETVEVR